MGVAAVAPFSLGRRFRSTHPMPSILDTRAADEIRQRSSTCWSTSSRDSVAAGCSRMNLRVPVPVAGKSVMKFLTHHRARFDARYHPEGWMCRLDRGARKRRRGAHDGCGPEGRRPAAGVAPRPLRTRPPSNGCGPVRWKQRAPTVVTTRRSGVPRAGEFARAVAHGVPVRHRQTALVKRGGQLPIERWINDPNPGDSGKAARRRSDAAEALPEPSEVLRGRGPPRPSIRRRTTSTPSFAGSRPRRKPARRPSQRHTDCRHDAHGARRLRSRLRTSAGARSFHPGRNAVDRESQWRCST